MLVTWVVACIWVIVMVWYRLGLVGISCILIEREEHVEEEEEEEELQYVV